MKAPGTTQGQGRNTPRADRPCTSGLAPPPPQSAPPSSKSVRKDGGKSANKVHYLCHWDGWDTDWDSYEPHDECPRPLVSAYNRAQREAKNKSS